MIEGIGQHCPFLLGRFHEGCMSGVSREELTEYASQCPTLSLDWGPFFDEGEEWQRGRLKIGNKYPDDGGGDARGATTTTTTTTTTTSEDTQEAKRRRFARKKKRRRR